MHLGWIVEPAKEQQPEEAERTRQQECRPPRAESLEQSDDQKRRDCGTDGRPAVEKRHRPTAFTPGKPFRHGFGRARPVASLAGAKQEAEEAERPQACRERRQHGCDRVERNGHAETGTRADRVEEPAGASLAERVSDPERDDDEREVRVVPVVMILQRRSKDAERLPIDVIDDRGEKEEGADPPAQTAMTDLVILDWRLLTGGAAVVNYQQRKSWSIGCKQWRSPSASSSPGARIHELDICCSVS